MLITNVSNPFLPRSQAPSLLPSLCGWNPLITYMCIIRPLGRVLPPHHYRRPAEQELQVEVADRGQPLRQQRGREVQEDGDVAQEEGRERVVECDRLGVELPACEEEV